MYDVQRNKGTLFCLTMHCQGTCDSKARVCCCGMVVAVGRQWLWIVVATAQWWLWDSGSNAQSLHTQRHSQLVDSSSSLDLAVSCGTDGRQAGKAVYLCGLQGVSVWPTNPALQ